jgi:site-specific DNA-methyltransferase (adenine-specific)
MRDKSKMTRIFENADCMDVMARYPDKHFDLAIVDPPYGINVNKMKMGRMDNKSWDNKSWDNKSYFVELFRICRNSIIWGANYFNLFPSKSFVVWDKGEAMYGRTFSEVELAYTSFNINGKIYKFNPMQTDRIHPTQKPIALYKWLLKQYAKPGDLLLDTHVGSASSLIAFEDCGFEYVGCELDADYYKAACARIKDFRMQLKLPL